MAHPPANTSNLSLERFIVKVAEVRESLEITPSRIDILGSTLVAIFKRNTYVSSEINKTSQLKSSSDRFRWLMFGEEEVKDNKRLLAFFSLARPETQGEEGG